MEGGSRLGCQAAEEAQMHVLEVQCLWGWAQVSQRKMLLTSYLWDWTLPQGTRCRT